jgi:hypothetical protein
MRRLDHWHWSCSVIDVPGGMRIEEDPAFERRSWIAERIGWAIMALFVFLGLLGFFGSGPASRASAGSLGTLRLEYERFVRCQAPTTLRLRIRSENGTARVIVWRDYLDGVKLEKILPDPARVEALEGFVIYEFDADGAREISVQFDLSARAPGVLAGTVAPDEANEVSFRQLVYP